MGRIIDNFKKYQFLLYELVKKEIKLKYRRSYLGILWTLIEPLLTTLILTLVFRSMLGKGGQNYPIYILSGRLLYTYFSNATKSAMKSIRTNSAMIKKVYVPKYIYPLSSVLSGYVTFVISLLVLIGMMGVFKVTPTFYLIEAIVPLALILVMTLGVGMILSTLAVFFRDLEYLWGVALMLVMYTCAIFYHVEDMKEFKWLVELNPLYSIILNFRNAIFGVPFDQFALIYSTIFSFGALLIGILLFYKQQDKFILNI